MEHSALCMLPAAAEFVIKQSKHSSATSAIYRLRFWSTANPAGVVLFQAGSDARQCHNRRGSE